MDFVKLKYRENVDDCDSTSETALWLALGSIDPLYSYIRPLHFKVSYTHPKPLWSLSLCKCPISSSMDSLPWSLIDLRLPFLEFISLCFMIVERRRTARSWFQGLEWAQSFQVGKKFGCFEVQRDIMPSMPIKPLLLPSLAIFHVGLCSHRLKRLEKGDRRGNLS